MSVYGGQSGDVDGLREKTVQVSGSPGAGRAEHVTRWKLSEEAVSMV